MSNAFYLDQIARLPLPGDNVVIATRRLAAGTAVQSDDCSFELDTTVLEGHRFAVQPIAWGEALLSWGLPFGRARRAIAPGSYVCNPGMLLALRERRLDFKLPVEANFDDEKLVYRLDEQNFRPAKQVQPYAAPRTFQGYRRGGRRGVGTRNHIVLLGTTALIGGYVRQLEARLKGLASTYDNIDGIVAVAHTEGGSAEANNLDLLLRTLAGFIIHPNVGAVLIVDDGGSGVTNALLRDYLTAHDYPLTEVSHRFLSLRGSFEADLAEGETIVRGWLAEVNIAPRSAVPLAELKIALQCGGSDAFSGISGNPLAAWVAKEIIRYGGAANLAETDELLGAETYVLQKVKDIETARKFLATVERFKTWMAWHGTSAESNTSGGNKFRGLYNNSLKSIGAAMKRHPEVRLDAVIDYGDLMTLPGFYFMDSPGNDLESIAGQVASGCTMIFFVTGNGSITNFPFVPTLKVVTTTRRYDLLSREMDVNAGAYLDGTPLAMLGQQMLDLTVETASGRRSVGEQAGHAQVQIWRDWPQTSDANLNKLLNAPRPEGNPLLLKAAKPGLDIGRPADRAIQSVGLILPTSLCAGQVARMAAERLNQRGLDRDQGLDRFVTLIHTEGCGASDGDAEALYLRTMLGYLTHPLVKRALLLEHGCEKTHNDYFRQRLMQVGLEPEWYGWASIQLDGGIEAVLEKIEAWFERALTSKAANPSPDAGGLRLGLVSNGPISATATRSLGQLTTAVVGGGGTVVVPGDASLLASEAYQQETIGTQPLLPTLAYGQQVTQPGFHVMDTPRYQWTENLTGLGATGVEIIVAYIGQSPLPGHPLVPTLQITAEAAVAERYASTLDLCLTGPAETWPAQLVTRLTEALSGNYWPKLAQQGNLDFQISRGLLGISL